MLWQAWICVDSDRCKFKAICLCLTSASCCFKLFFMLTWDLKQAMLILLAAALRCFSQKKQVSYIGFWWRKKTHTKGRASLSLQGPVLDNSFSVVVHRMDVFLFGHYLLTFTSFQTQMTFIFLEWKRAVWTLYKISPSVSYRTEMRWPLRILYVKLLPGILKKSFILWLEIFMEEIQDWRFLLQ